MTSFDIGDMDAFDLSFKVFHELMAKKVARILLVSSPYDAFIMEEDGRLAERIIHEYRGLNLSRPPRLTWVSSLEEAMQVLSEKRVDLVLSMPRLEDTDPCITGRTIKQQYPDLPVFLLAHSTSRHLFNLEYESRGAIDQLYVWRGNSDLLLAIIKNVEDHWNIDYDTRRARVRVIIMVEDSPVYRSTLLPLLYKEIVLQTQAVMEESLNDEHRILRMRARPKILVARTFEEAAALFRSYKRYLLSIISDVRFPRRDRLDGSAGFDLLRLVKSETPDIPLLIFSSEESNRERAAGIPAVFLNKNSPSLNAEIRTFFKHHLGFGDFIFRTAGGKEIARAANLRELEDTLKTISDESLYCHAAMNDFSSWLMARSEILLASRLKPLKTTDFTDITALRQYLIDCLRSRRKGRQRGVITAFDTYHYDPDADFIKIGRGSLGGKARGLAFVSTLLKENPRIQEKYPGVNIAIPKTLVISTEGFDTFIAENGLAGMATAQQEDAAVTSRFLSARLPDWLVRHLMVFLSQASYPLAVRSSSLLEDAQFQPFAGIYKTVMLPNNHPDIETRCNHLCDAIRLVYASTYLEAPRAYARNTQQRMEEEKMAVLVQQVTGGQYGDYFYPDIAGVAQSYNFYPIAGMKPDEGIAHIALGLGKTVVEGGTAMRFSPRYPHLVPHLSSVDATLKNAQYRFFALNMEAFPRDFASATALAGDPTLAELDIAGQTAHAPVRTLASTYIHEDHRIRDTAPVRGTPVLTFSSVLKHRQFPLAQILCDLLEMGREGMGCPVEIEFAVDLNSGSSENPTFALLQIRPMAFMGAPLAETVTREEIASAACHTTTALGNGSTDDIRDIVIVRPDVFDPGRTVEIAAEVGCFNRDFVDKGSKYVLIGPGRWGSSDRWLGIPVEWRDISEAGVIVETADERLAADPSQGSHFFHNITSLGVSYLTIRRNCDDFLDIERLTTGSTCRQGEFLAHHRLPQPVTIKVDGKRSTAVILIEPSGETP